MDLACGDGDADLEEDGTLTAELRFHRDDESAWKESWGRFSETCYTSPRAVLPGGRCGGNAIAHAQFRFPPRRAPPALNDQPGQRRIGA